MLTLGVKARALMLCLGLLLAGAAASLYAGGQGEARLADVQKLMQQQDYNGALKLLAAIQRTNPNLRDETTRLISEVIIIRGQMYNSVLSQLVKSLYDEHDEDKSVQLIAELQRIDPARSLNETAGAFDFVRFFKLMDNAAALVAARKIPEALSLYLLPFTDPKAAGFTMQRPDFDSAGYGNVVETGVHDAVSRIVSVGSQEIREAPRVAAVPHAVGSLLSGAASQGALEGFDAAVSPLREGANAEGAVRMIAAGLSDMNKSIRETRGKGRDDVYLKYVISICLGREKKTEGIALALRVLWQERAQETANASETAAAGAFTAARAAYDAQDFKSADAKFDAAYYRSVVALKAIALAGAGLVTTATTGWSVTPGGTEALRLQIAHASSEQEQAAEAQAFRTLIRYRTELGTLPVITANAATDGTKVQEETAQLSSARARLAARAVDASADEKEWRARSSTLTSMTATGVQLAPLARSASAMADLFAGFIDGDLQPRDLSFALRLAQIRGITYQKSLDKAVTLEKQGQDLMAGTKDGQKVEVAGIPKLYPDQAARRFQDGSALLDSLTKDIGDLAQSLRSDTPYIAGNSAILALLKGQGGGKGYEGLLQTARDEQRRLNQLLEDAQKQIDDAAIASREGDNWYTAALTSLNKKDPDGASSFLDQSNEAYINSQRFAYTEHAVTRTDKDIPDLQAKIAGLRTALAIANSQKDLAVIDQLLNEGNYLRANDALNSAQAVWEKAQPGSPNPAFEIRRENIQNALQGTVGREISRLDPKADAVNTYIKYAQDNLAAGQLAEAEKNVNYALTVAPNFGTAKVLALLIKKTTNPIVFQKEATAEIAKYMKMATDAKNRDDQNAALNALLDYSSLDPKFAALAAGAILELRYSLGILPRPPNPREIADSNALVQQADLLQQQGTPDAYASAQDLVRQALEKNRYNKKAMELDGVIRTKLQSTALSVLSPADTQSFKLALSLYLSGNVPGAYDIVQNLWDSSQRNRTYADLIKLRKRCEVALNIS